MVASVLVKKVAELQIKKLFNQAKEGVYVGYPEGPKHSDSDLTNAQIAFLNSMGTRHNKVSRDIKEIQNEVESYKLALQAYIRSKGDPRWKIPPRPFIEPGIERDKGRITTYLLQYVDKFLDGDIDLADKAKELAGQAAVNSIRSFIRDYPANGLTPNAPSTIKEKGVDHPLIGQTGELIRSLTYVIR